MHLDRTAAALHDAMHDGKSHPGAFTGFLGRKKRIEDAIHDIGRDAFAGVLDPQQQLALSGHPGPPASGGRIGIHLPDGE